MQTFCSIKYTSTNIDQKTLRKLLNFSMNLINKEPEWKYTNLNPTQPSIRGHLKICKVENPVRFTVEWKTAPYINY